MVGPVAAARNPEARACAWAGWPVLLTGHSLGGGVAAVLAMLLNEQRIQGREVLPAAFFHLSLNRNQQIIVGPENKFGLLPVIIDEYPRVIYQDCRIIQAFTVLGKTRKEGIDVFFHLEFDTYGRYQMSSLKSKRQDESSFRLSTFFFFPFQEQSVTDHSMAI